MTDINQNTVTGAPDKPGKDQVASDQMDELYEHRILNLMELFYFAYRDFTAEGDEVLARIGFGRAHHRIIHFVHHYPGLRVADLLAILKITKQSLARVLKQLIDEGYIRRHQGKEDRRERRLFTTAKGRELAGQLAAPQLQRFENALASLSENERQTVKQFFLSLLQDPHRHEVITLLSDDEPMIRDDNNREEHSNA